MLLTKTDVSTFRYRSYHNCLQKIIRNNRQFYLHDKCKEYRQNRRKLWQLINRIIGKENNKHNTIESLKVDNLIKYDSESITALPTLAELETAQTLVTLQEDHSTIPQPSTTSSTNILKLQEPNVPLIPETTELVLETPPWVKEEQRDNILTDAMDKIVEHKDVSHPEPWYWMKFRDCMDIIMGRISELVETVNLHRH